MGKQGFANIEEKIAKLKASNICSSKNHISLENKSVKREGIKKNRGQTYY